MIFTTGFNLSVPGFFSDKLLKSSGKNSPTPESTLSEISSLYMLDIEDKISSSI